MSSSLALESIKTSIEASYPVGTVLNLTLLQYPGLRPPSRERMPLNYRVDTSMGAYCLKSNPATKSQKRVDFEQDFQQALNASDPQVAPKFINASTKLQFDDRTWWLEEFVPAPHQPWWLPTWNAQHCRSAGSMLARYHRAVLPLLIESNPSASGTVSGARSVVGIPLNFADVYSNLAAIAAADQRGIHPDYARDWVTCRAQLELVLNQIEHVFGFGATTVDQRYLRYVHGDYHAGNTLFVNGAARTVVDFEHVHVDHLLLDVCYGLIMFATNWSGTDENEPFNDVFSRFFLEGYLSYEDAEIEVDAVPRYIALSAILIGGWLLEMAGNATENADVIFHCFKRVVSSWQYLAE